MENSMKSTIENEKGKPSVTDKGAWNHQQKRIEELESKLEKIRALDTYDLEDTYTAHGYECPDMDLVLQDTPLTNPGDWIKREEIQAILGDKPK